MSPAPLIDVPLLILLHLSRNDDHAPSQVRAAVLKTLKNLKLDYLDSYLVKQITHHDAYWGTFSLFYYSSYHHALY